MWIAVTIIILAIVFFLRSEYERRSLAVETVTITSKKLSHNRTFVFLSDLHDCAFGPNNLHLLTAIEQIKPDFVLIGGDFIVSDKKGRIRSQQALFLLERLAAKYKVYCGNGNHENRLLWKQYRYGNYYNEYKAQLERFGVIYLADAAVMSGSDLRITGVDLPPKAYYKQRRGGRVGLTAAELFHPGDAPENNPFEILLAHSPMYFSEYQKWGADLSLAGHFHGGTIRLPLLGGVMTPQLQFFCPYCAGVFEQDGRWMIVSRGLGTHSVNIRWNNKPQLLVVHLQR